MVATVLSIPSSALIFDGEGTRVATVGADNRARLKSVTIAVESSAAPLQQRTDHLVIQRAQRIRLAGAFGEMT